MITFYEGLPRSGKSFSAMRDEIIPALQAGRAVVAYIEGIDHEKIAAVSGVDLSRCEALLIALTRDQVAEWWKHTPNDALVVLDEAQNFWPARRQPLGPEITREVAEHGHKGLDIILMGQLLKDVHSLWRHRVERKLYFLKKTALGKPDSYSCTISTAIPDGDTIKFVTVSTNDYTYDPKYFGTYKSHTDGTNNKATKVDDRVVIWNRPLFRKWLPIAGVVALFLAYYVYNLFHGGLEKGLVKDKPQPISEKVIKSPPPSSAPESVKPGLTDGIVPESPKDLIQDLTEKHRIRLIGVWASSGRAQNGIVEWRDAGASLVQSLTFRDIEGLGYSVFVNSTASIAVLVRGTVRLVASSWSIDKREAVASEKMQRDVSGIPQSPRYSPSMFAPLGARDVDTGVLPGPS